MKFRPITEAIDTETPAGRAMWQMVGLMAEFEHSLISERTKAGVKAAKKRGVKFGRKRKLTPQQIDLARKLIERGENKGAVAEGFKVNRTTHHPLPGACRMTAACANVLYHTLLQKGREMFRNPVYKGLGKKPH